MRVVAADLWQAGRDLVPIVLVAFVVSHLIRGHLLEWYLVPSSSMEPTLHGDPVSGDLVLVDKTAYAWGRPERFDMVVLRSDNGSGPHGHLVKRVVAFGDGPWNWVSLREGDVFLGQTRQGLKRCVKHPLDARDMRLTNFAFPEVGKRKVTEYFRSGPAWRVETGSGERARHIVLAPGADDLASLRLLLSPGAPRARHLCTALPVTASFLDHRGERRGDYKLPRDIGVEFHARIEDGCAGLQLVLECRDRYYSFSYAASGEVSSAVMGELRELPAVPVDGQTTSGGELGPCGGKPVHRAGPALVPGRSAHFEFGYLDGWLFLVVDGILVWWGPQDLSDPDPPSDPPFPTGGHENLLHVAAAGGAARIDRLRVFHDVHYRPLIGPSTPVARSFELAPGVLFLLGDNTFDSKDSRMGIVFRVEDLVGRPMCVVGPVARARWLIR